MAKEEGARRDDAAEEFVILQEAVFEDVEATSMESAQDRLALEGSGDDLAFAQEMEAC